MHPFEIKKVYLLWICFLFFAGALNKYKKDLGTLLFRNSENSELLVLKTILKKLIRVGTLTIVDASGRLHIFSGRSRSTVKVHLHNKYSMAYGNNSNHGHRRRLYGGSSDG